MQFGSDFNNYDAFNSDLPVDSPKNLHVLSRGTGLGHIYLGFPSWGDKTWIGSIYPKGITKDHFPGEYAKVFNSIEFNGTHYRSYTSEQCRALKEMVNNDLFLFCPKFPNRISHFSNLLDVEDATSSFLNGIRGLGENLGPILLQVANNFPPKKLANLLGYIAILPKDLQFFVEVRDPQWFSDSKMFDHLTNGLAHFNTGLVVTDTPGRRDLMQHITLTVPKLFLRYVGLGGTPTDDSRLLQWHDRIEKWRSEGLSEAFIFLHLPNEPQSILYSQQVKRMFLLT